jgi:hypothetical protein
MSMRQLGIILFGRKEMTFKGLKLFVIHVFLQNCLCICNATLSLQEMSSRSKVFAPTRYNFILAIKEMAAEVFHCFQMCHFTKLYLRVFYLFTAVRKYAIQSKCQCAKWVAFYFGKSKLA